MIVAAISFIVVAIAFGLLLTRLALPRQPGFLPDDVEALFSPKRYQPLARLLDPADEGFLATNPACTWQLRRKLEKGVNEYSAPTSASWPATSNASAPGSRWS